MILYCIVLFVNKYIYIYLEPKRPAEIGQTRVLKKVQVSLKSTALCKILDFGNFQESSRNI